MDDQTACQDDVRIFEMKTFLLIDEHAVSRRQVTRNNRMLISRLHSRECTVDSHGELDIGVLFPSNGKHCHFDPDVIMSEKI